MHIAISVFLGVLAALWLFTWIERRREAKIAARITWRKAELLSASPDWYLSNPHPDAAGHPIARGLAFLALSIVFGAIGFLVCSGAFLPEPSNYGGLGVVLGIGLAWWTSGIPGTRARRAQKARFLGLNLYGDFFVKLNLQIEFPSSCQRF